jgi:hypothetical protein
VWRALGQLRPVLPATSHEEPEENPIQNAEFDVPAMLPLAIDLISDTALAEPATLPRTPSRSADSGDQLSERVAMEVGGWKTTSVFHRYAIVDNEDIANAMDMLERSQDQQRRHLEKAGAAKGAQIMTIIDGSPKESSRREPKSITTGNSALTSRLHHVGDVVEVSGHAYRGTKKARKALK